MSEANETARKRKTNAKKRTPFNTTIYTETQNEFREYCNEIGMPLNVVLEAFMKQFINGEFTLKFANNNVLSIELEEK